MLFILVIERFTYCREKSSHSEINSNLKFAKNSPIRLYNLFNWLGEEKNSDRIIYELAGDVVDKPTTLETIKDLKNTIKFKIDEVDGDYFLTREMIKTVAKITLESSSIVFLL